MWKCLALLVTENYWDWWYKSGSEVSSVTGDPMTCQPSYLLTAALNIIAAGLVYWHDGSRDWCTFYLATGSTHTYLVAMNSTNCYSNHTQHSCRHADGSWVNYNIINKTALRSAAVVVQLALITYVLLIDSVDCETWFKCVSVWFPSCPCWFIWSIDAAP